MDDGAVIPSSEGDRRAVGMCGPVTARLRLSPVADGDLEELFALHADPRAFAEDLTAPLADREQMRWVLTQWIRSWHEHGIGYLTVRALEADQHSAPPLPLGDFPPTHGTSPLPRGLLGVAGLTPLDHQGRRALSAYWRLAPAATGCGIAAEAMAAVLADPRLGVRDQEVVAVTAAGNRPSRALAARLGFLPAPPGRAVPGGRDGDILLIRPPQRPGTSAATP